MQQIEENGKERGNHLLQIRLTKSQHERLKALSIASGHNTISSYVRTNLLSPSIEMKLNKIMSLLEKEAQRGDENDRRA